MVPLVEFVFISTPTPFFPLLPVGAKNHYKAIMVLSTKTEW